MREDAREAACCVQDSSKFPETHALSKCRRCQTRLRYSSCRRMSTGDFEGTTRSAIATSGGPQRMAHSKDINIFHKTYGPCNACTYARFVTFPARDHSSTIQGHQHARHRCREQHVVGCYGAYSIRTMNFPKQEIRSCAERRNRVNGSVCPVLVYSRSSARPAT